MNLELILFVVTIITVINGLIILPILFYFFVTPKLEKKLGKLEVDIYLCNRYTRFLVLPFDISYYIFQKFILKILGFDHEKIKIRSRYSLQKVNYSINDASKIEIIFSLLCILNFVTLLTIMIWIFIKHPSECYTEFSNRYGKFMG